MKGVFANRNSKGDFVLNELEKWADRGGNVYIASAFFTDAEIVEKLLIRGCSIYLVVRLGFPTNPAAIERVMNHPGLKLRFYTGHSYHPKLYIFNDEVALVGSANLTRSALMTNQEVVVGVDASDDRFLELMSIFEDYWEGAEVLSNTHLATYREIYRQCSKHDAALSALGGDLLKTLGDTSPDNIDRHRPKGSRQSLFISSFRKTYQEAVAAFNVVRRAYESSGYRKVEEAEIPLRIEIDSFISYVRERVAYGEKWSEAPLRPETEQARLIADLISGWRQIEWRHFEQTIVKSNYPRLSGVFASRNTIMAASDEALFDALATLHSFHDRFRFFDGGLATWKQQFPTFNDPVRTRETIAYLVHGDGDIVERMANAIYDPRYKLNEFGQANVQELVGWCNREELPILNGRTTKVLRFFGSKVRQL